METMKDLYKVLKNKYEVEIIPDIDNSIHGLEWKDEYDIWYCVIQPHEGNNWQFMLRANPEKTFDRWSVADIEWFYKPSELDKLYEDLCNKTKILKELLDIYVEEAI